MQSTRVVVEQTIGDLKKSKVLDFNRIADVKMVDKVLDCVIALHNLRQIFKVNPQFTIPVRRHAVEREYVFVPTVKESEVDFKIPDREPDLSLPELKHIDAFKEFLPSAAPAIDRAVKKGGQDCVFFPSVRARGKNLYEGAYVLQLQVQDEGLGIWTVRYRVGASYSYETHVGYFRMSQDNAALNNICDCYSG